LAVNKINDGTIDVFFFAIRGQIYGLNRTWTDESRPGDDGTAKRLLGLKPKQFALRVECHVDTYQAAKTLGLLLQGSKGYTFDITQEGTLNTDCMLQEVEVAEPEMNAHILRGVYPADGTFKNGQGAEFIADLVFEYTGDA
jgi:hypothetical protein